MNLNRFKDLACTCNTCVSMCKHRPCWPTPEEAIKIIKAGFANKMMHDYWCGDNVSNDEDIPVICGAIPGYEGKMAGFKVYGTCSLLENDRCILQYLGLKPIEGRKASCKRKIPENFHKHVAMLWKGEIGYKVLKLWKKAVASQTSAPVINSHQQTNKGGENNGRIRL